MRISKNVVIVALKSRIFFTKRCFSSRLHRCVLWTKVLLRPPPPPVFDLRKCTTCMLRHSADLALCLIRPEASNCGALISHCLSSNVTHSLYIILGSATSGGFFVFVFLILAFQRFYVCPLELPVNTVACRQLVYTTFCRRRGPFIEMNSSCI